MLTIAGGIILGFLGLGVLRWMFGGPTRAEQLAAYVAANRAAELEAERRIIAKSDNRHAGKS